MDNPTILVADGDPKNLQILRESLEASGFEVIVASDGLQAWQKISSDVPDLILSEVNLPKLDGFQLLEKLKADPVTSSIPLMFLTNRRELKDRVRSLRGGVKDYMIKPLHVKEVIARVRMILRRMERFREEEIEAAQKLAGRLEEFSVVDLIEHFGMERKTGVLTLYNANNKCGEVYFRDGAVVNASLGNLKAEKAVYQMLPWKRGHFTMTFKEINVPDEISVSNLGLLLQGFRRMEERERLFKMLPSPETTFVISKTFRNILQKREMSADVAKFVALIDGKRDILQIIDESTYDDIKTLERLVKLYQQGFIKPGKPTSAEEEEIDLASSIAEPSIMDEIPLDQDGEQRLTFHPLVEPETPLPSPRTESMRPTSPQAFRPPDSLPSYSERKIDDRPVLPPKPPKEFPPSPRWPDEDLEPPAAKFPDLKPQTEDNEPEDRDEPRGYPDFFYDSKAEKTPSAEEQPPSVTARRKEEIPPTPRGEDRGTVSGDREMPLAARHPAPEGESAEPELLPIDLNALMQRPIEPPAFLDEPSGAELPPPSVPKIDLIRAGTEKADAPPPAAKTSAPAANVSIPPSTPAEGKGEPQVRAPSVSKMSPETQPPLNLVAEPEPQVKARSVFEVEPVLKPSLTPEVIAASATLQEPVAPPFAPVMKEPEVKSYAADLIPQRLAMLLHNRQVQHPKLVVIGREGSHISPMVRQLLGPESSLRKLESATFQYLELGERKLHDARPFEVIGISMEQQFTRLLDAAKADLIGYIVLIEAYRKDGMEYLSYLLNMLKTVYRQPLGIAVIKSPTQKNMTTDTLRDLLNLVPTDLVQECNPLDRGSVIEFLNGFTSESNLQRS